MLGVKVPTPKLATQPLPGGRSVTAFSRNLKILMWKSNSLK